MKSTRIILLMLICLTAAHAAVPKKIAKQIEGDWRDGRYANVKFGPFVSGHIATPKGSTHKGIAVRVGEKGEDEGWRQPLGGAQGDYGATVVDVGAELALGVAALLDHPV